MWWLQLFLPSRSLANCCELYHWPPVYSRPLEGNADNTEGSNYMCLEINQASHISQIHRPIQIGMDLERSLVQPPVWRRATLHWKSLLKTVSSWIKKTLENRDPTASLSTLLECLITLRMNIFLNSQSQTPVSACVHYLTMSLGEEADSIVMTSCPKALAGGFLVPWSHLLLRLSKPISLGLFSLGKCCNPDHLSTPLWTCSRSSMPFLYWDPKVGAVSRCGANKC